MLRFFFIPLTDSVNFSVSQRVSGKHSESVDKSTKIHSVDGGGNEEGEKTGEEGEEDGEEERLTSMVALYSW